jgi:2'-5' RNA ligase
MYKRLFFGLQCQAPWPENYPKGRVLKEEDRHLTFAFLGNVDFKQFEAKLSSLPQPHFKVGIVGKFDQLIFLPKRNHTCATWHIEWLEDVQPLNEYRSQLLQWLEKERFLFDKRDWLPHVTIARKPFEEEEWKNHFESIPVSITSLHLFESLGSSQYKSLWQFPFLPPFIELSHTADIAYLVRGMNVEALYLHGAMALAEHFPPLLKYVSPVKKMENLEEVVMELNEIVSSADSAVGCPFKAVSFHGKLEKKGNDVLEWEMIIDV